MNLFTKGLNTGWEGANIPEQTLFRVGGWAGSQRGIHALQPLWAMQAKCHQVMLDLILPITRKKRVWGTQPGLRELCGHAAAQGK